MKSINVIVVYDTDYGLDLNFIGYLNLTYDEDIMYISNSLPSENLDFNVMESQIIPNEIKVEDISSEEEKILETSQLIFQEAKRFIK